MTKPIDRDAIYRKRAFDADTIELCVRWYITYRLSYRDLVEMMAERGVQVAHSTILRWVTRYVPEFVKRWSRFSKAVGLVNFTVIDAEGARQIVMIHEPLMLAAPQDGNSASGTPPINRHHLKMPHGF